MTRRRFYALPGFVIASAAAPQRLVVPVHHVLDQRVKWRAEVLRRFWGSIWPEAVHDFGKCGIYFASTTRAGEVRRSPSSNPVFTGLDRGVINLVITGDVPLAWDRGRGVSGVTTRYAGCHLCLVGLNRAHCHQVPLLSVNTCVHELLHAFFEDIFERRPQGFSGQAREFRIDWYATRLWLFHDGAAIREAARRYLARLHA